MRRRGSSKNGIHPSAAAAFYQHLANVLLEATAEDEPDEDFITNEITALFAVWDEMSEHESLVDKNFITVEHAGKKLTLRFSVEVEEVE